MQNYVWKGLKRIELSKMVIIIIYKYQQMLNKTLLINNKQYEKIYDNLKLRH